MRHGSDYPSVVLGMLPQPACALEHEYQAKLKDHLDRSDSPSQNLRILPFCWDLSLPGRPVVDIPVRLVEEL